MMQKLIQNFLHPPKEQGLKMMMQKLIQNFLHPPQGLKRPWLHSLGHYLGTWHDEILNLCVNYFFLLSRGFYFLFFQHLCHFYFFGTARCTYAALGYNCMENINPDDSSSIHIYLFFEFSFISHLLHFVHISLDSALRSWALSHCY